MSAIIYISNDTGISLLLNFDLTFHSFLFSTFYQIFLLKFLKAMPISKITPLLIQFFVNAIIIKKHMLILILTALCCIFVSHLSFITSTFHLSSKIYISIICRISLYCIPIFTHCRTSNV